MTDSLIKKLQKAAGTTTNTWALYVLLATAEAIVRQHETGHLWHFNNDQEIIDHFMMLYREYGNCPDSNLEESGIELKRRVLAAVAEIEKEIREE